MNQVIDQIANVTADTEVFANELNSLSTLKTGLIHLANFVLASELRRKRDDGVEVFSFGWSDPAERSEMETVTCAFHWFATTIYNYARLIGYIQVMSAGQFARLDLTDRTKQKDLTDAISLYVDSIPELASVVEWRHKVAGHFAITAPRKDDKRATLDLSITHPVTFMDGRFFVGQMALYRSGPGDGHASELPTWSLSDVFEKLVPRYWPDLTTGTRSAD